MVVILLILPDAWLSSGTTARNCMPHRYISRICITDLNSNSQDHEQSVASTKEEEWITKKTTELTTTKQVETRVKRQVVLEDGKIIDDSGPVVSTNTRQDTEKQQYETREHRTPDAKALPEGSTNLVDNKPDGALVKRQQTEIPPNVSSLVREVQEERELSREQTDELLETEDVKHLGDIDDESYLNAVRSGAKDLRPLLESALRPTGGPRVIRHTTNTNRVADTENTNLRSTALSDGRIITEKQTTDEHEHIINKHLPEDEARSFDSGSHTCLSIHGEERIVGTRETAHSLAEDGSLGEMRYSAESRHAERYGDLAAKLGRDHWESLSDRLRRSRENAERKDVITKRPLDFDAEERSRKAETNKWLDHHFGSDSRSSQSSRDSLVSGGADQRHVAKSQGTEEGYFNITIRSKRDAPVLVACVPKQNTSPHKGTNKYFQGVSEWSDRRVQPQRPARAIKANKVENLSRYETTNTAREVKQFDTQRPSPPQRSRHRKQTTTPSPSFVGDINGYVKDEPPIDYSTHLRKENTTPTTETKIRPGSCSPPTKLEPSRGRSVHFPADTVASKQKVTSAIGQGIRKLVGKIRSASLERKSRRRSASPPLIIPPRPEDETTYQKCNVIDSHIGSEKWTAPPAQRYYLGEDPYGGSIYGRENKYINNFKQTNGRYETTPVTTTLGRYGKNEKKSGILIRDKNEDNKIQSSNRTSLTRSKSCLANQHSYPIYRSNPHLAVTHDALKSPSLVVSLVNKSKTNLAYNEDDKRETFMMRLHQRAPELYQTLQAAE